MDGVGRTDEEPFARLQRRPADESPQARPEITRQPAGGNHFLPRAFVSDPYPFHSLNLSNPQFTARENAPMENAMLTCPWGIRFTVTPFH